MNLKNIILSKRSQTQKAIWIWISYPYSGYEISRIGKSVWTESRVVISRGWREGRIESDCLEGSGIFLGGDKKMFWN